MTLEEAYDIVNGKYIKDEAEYKHYTSIENFHKIVSSGYIKGSSYPANTYNYGKGHEDDKNEICLVRSDRSPDFCGGFNLSGNVGDIKFTFKRDTIVPKFGKIKPIDEYPVQAKFFAQTICKYIKREATFLNNKLLNTLKIIKTKGWKLTDEEKSKVLKVIDLCCSKETYKKVKEDLDYIKKQYNMREKMESRIRADKVDLKYVDKIMIPDYLKNNKSILNDIDMLKKKGINNIIFYKCKYPREKI